MNATREIQLHIAFDHPALAGHFPGNPIIPGVVLLDEALFAIDAATGCAHRGIAWAKFLRPVLPGQALTIRFGSDADGAHPFEILAGVDKVASGRLCPIAVP